MVKISEIIDDDNELIGQNDSPQNGADMETRVGKNTTDQNKLINGQRFSWNTFATFFSGSLYEGKDGQDNLNRLSRLVFDTFGEFILNSKVVDYDKLGDEQKNILRQLTSEFAIGVDEIMASNSDGEQLREDDIVNRSSENIPNKKKDNIIPIKKNDCDLTTKKPVKVFTKGSIIDSIINEENSQLSGNKYIIPTNVLEYIRDAKNRYGNVDGIKRADDKLESKYLTYESLKRLLNFFENEGDKIKKELAGGGLMYGFVKQTLQSERARVKPSEITNDIKDNTNASIDKIITNNSNSGYRKLNF